MTQNRMIAGRAIISALVLWLAFSGVAAAEQLYVNEDGWWRDGGAFNVSGTPIQAAVDAAGAGDAIFVWNGSYTENVVVDETHVDVHKTFTLEGEGADVVTVTGCSSSLPVFTVAAHWVRISGFNIIGYGSWAGIYLGNTDHCSIYNNTASNNGYGIYLSSSSNYNTLANNNASNNDNYGIYISSSSYNTLANNTATLNSFYGGIRLECSSYNTLTNNNASNNCLYGIYLHDSDNNTLTDNNNTANLNQNYGIDLYNSSNNTLINNTANRIRIISSSYNTLTNNNVLKNANYGIYLHDSDNNTLTNNTANLIYIISSSYNTLTNNTASNNDYGIYDYGIYLSSSSNYNTLANNDASNNDNYGIYISSSSYNTLANNIVNLNNYGIYLQDSDSNTISKHTVTLNSYGIYLHSSSSNTITCNMVQNNTERGFYLSSGSTGNNISHNNIIENGNYNTASGGLEWQLYNGQSDPVEVKQNYWGDGMNNSTIDVSIYDDEEGQGEVVFYPFETDPVPCAPGPEPLTFTAADAAIALQIAVGSRPYDSRLDVNGDGNITSLDALMILQATGNTQQPSEIEIAYDDGSAERYWSMGDGTFPPPDSDGGSCCGYAVRLTTPDSELFTINTIKVFGWRYGSDCNMRVEVWDQNKNTLYSNISHQSDYFTFDPSWAYVDVPDIDVSGDFYAVVFTDSVNASKTPTTGVFVGYDNSSVVGRSYVAQAGDKALRWHLDTSQETTNWMIRAVGEK